MRDDTIQTMKVKGFGTKHADCFGANLLFIMDLRDAYYLGVSIVHWHWDDYTILFLSCLALPLVLIFLNSLNSCN